MIARFIGLFTTKKMRDNFNVTLTFYSDGAKTGRFDFILTNVRFYVSPTTEIIAVIPTSS